MPRKLVIRDVRFCSTIQKLRDKNLLDRLIIFLKSSPVLFLTQEVFTEMEEKYGEVEEMNVCDNLGDHLVGNVYVKVGDGSILRALIQMRKCGS